MVPVECPGPCNGKARRAQAVYKEALADWGRQMAGRHTDDTQPDPGRPVPPDIRAWPGDPVFCLRCQGAIRTQLAELDDLAAHLASMPVLRAPSDSGNRVSGTRGTPSPSPAHDDLDELAGWLRDWQCVAQGAEPLARRGYLATVITTTTAWLVLHFDSLIVDPDVAGDFGSEVRSWHRSLAEKSRTGMGLKHMNKPCPRCKLFTLWRADGEAYVRCSGEDCQRYLSLDEYDTIASENVA